MSVRGTRLARSGRAFVTLGRRSSSVAAIAVMGLAILGADRVSREAGSRKSLSDTVQGAVAGAPDCTDGDGDGYGSGADCLGPDCNDGNAEINPGESEACDGANTKCCNSVDDNCDGAVDENASLFGRTVDDASVCFGGDNDLDPCTVDGDCPNGNCRTPDEIQPAICDDGPNAGLTCTDGADCPDGVCVLGQLTILKFDDLAVGDLCVEGLGICAAVGEVVCKADGTGTECTAEAGTPETEGPAGDPTCFDRKDNDCDGLVDHGNPDEPDRISPCKTDEVCNNFDDDNDGEIDEDFNLGDSCTVGQGLCENTGELVCDGSGGVRCNAFAFTPGIESGPGSLRCRDGQDNDCDGVTDLADSGCQEVEKCDGKDNDGDGMTDEDFAAALGQVCTAGQGPCQASGITICSADGTTTVCDAVALTGTPEGPSGATCNDGIDNDCDGQLDTADFDCGGLDLAVTCSLPYRLGRPGADCTGWHVIRYEASGGMGNLDVVAELRAVTPDGTILASLPVQNGDDAHLASRLDEEDWKWVSRTNRSRGTWHEMFAPIPLLVVTAQDGKNTAQAFCSNVPFVDVIQPSDTVASGDDAVIPVMAAIPLTDVSTLEIKVNGVDIVPAMGLDPATAFPGGPYSDTVDINGVMVQVDDLVVSSGAVDEPAANTVSFTLSGLDCGGNIVIINATPAPTRFRMNFWSITDSCHQDDGTDRGTAIIFKVEVTTPVEGEVTAGGPTNVVGDVCHGLEIASTNVNGFQVDVSGQTLMMGDGENSGDTYRLHFDVDVPEADLRALVDAGTGGSGTFTKGSNRLVAQACDVDANCTYDSLFFAVGPIIAAPSASTFLAASAVAAVGDVERAFVLSITQTGINNFFEHLKNKNKRCLGDRARDAIQRTRPERKKIPVDGACDPPTAMFVNNTSLRNDNFPLGLTLQDSPTPDPREGAVEVRINLPPIDIEGHFDGYCEAGCVCLFGGCACAVCVTVDLDGRFNQMDMGLEFTLTRNRLLQSGVPREERDPLDFNFDIGTSDPNDFTRIRGEIDIGCLLGFILDVIDFFFQVLTFGLWDPGLGSPIVRELTADDIVEKMGSLDGDPMDVDLARFENRDLPEFGTRQRDSRVSDAAITSTGLAVAIAASFAPEPSEIDPAAANIQGTPAKNAPIPVPPFNDAQGNVVEDATILISDDVFNQLFFSMVQTGRLRTQFEVTRTLGNFIPEDCSTITEDRKRARCIGLHAEDTCDRFCARFDGCDDDCEIAFPYDIGDSNFTNRRQCCRAARIGRNTNIILGTTLILTGRVSNPPKLLIDDNPATDPVEVILQYDQISIALIADRDGDGMLDPSDTLESLSACTFGDLDAEFGTQSTSQTPCKLWETCLTARLNLSLEVIENDRGRPRIKFNFEGLDREVPFGVQCGGGYETPDLDFFNGEAGRTETMDLLEDRLGDSTPPLDADGMELGRAVLFQKDRIVAIETQPAAQDDGFQDYIGVTGFIVPRVNTCGNGVCDTDENEDDCNCPDDCP